MLQVRSACTDLTNHWKRTNSAFRDHVRPLKIFDFVFSGLLSSLSHQIILIILMQVEQVRSKVKEAIELTPGIQVFALTP